MLLFMLLSRYMYGNTQNANSHDTGTVIPRRLLLLTVLRILKRDINPHTTYVCT